MKTSAIFASAAMLVSSVEAFGAAPLPTCNGLSLLSSSAVAALFTPNAQYTCGTNGVESWNELHSGGLITDYKRGPADSIDPSKQIGTYTVSSDASGGVLNDTYGGTTFSYHIASGGGTAYYYCGVSSPAPTGPLTITIQPSHC
jgi:hypothetical protein